MSSIYERMQYPTKRCIGWMRTALNGMTWDIIRKGYQPDEAKELAWNVLEDIDLQRCDDVDETIKKRIGEILPKDEAESIRVENMLNAIRCTVSGFDSAHFYMSFNTMDEKLVATALVKAGVLPYQVNAGSDYEGGYGSYVLVNFDGYVDYELAKVISAFLPGILINVEDCWDSICSYVFIDGREAVLGEDYEATFLVTPCDDEYGCFDTEFDVKRKDGTSFTSGGCGMVDVNNLPAYLKPYGFDVKSFNEDYGNIIESADCEPLDDNEESFMDFELSNGFATREDYGLAVVGGA